MLQWYAGPGPDQQRPWNYSDDILSVQQTAASSFSVTSFLKDLHSETSNGSAHIGGQVWFVLVVVVLGRYRSV